MTDFAYLITLLEGRTAGPEGKINESTDPEGVP